MDPKLPDQNTNTSVDPSALGETPVVHSTASIPSAIPSVPTSPAGMSITPPSGQPPAAPIVASTPPAPAKKSMKKMFVLVAAVFLVLLVGGSVYAYFAYKNSPKIVVQDAFTNMGKVNSLAYSAKLDVMASSASMKNSPSLLPGLGTSSGKEVGVGITVDGAMDMKDPDATKTMMSLHMVTYGLGLNSIEVNADTRRLGDDAYVKLTKLPQLGLFDLSFLKDKWIHVNLVELSKKYGFNLSKTKKLSDADQKKIDQLFSNPKLVRSIKLLADESLDDKDMYHYQIEIDKSQFLSAYSGYIDITSEKMLTPQEKNLQLQAMRKLNFTDTQIWIGKKDHLLYKITMNMLYASEKDAPTKIALMLRMKDHNKAVSVSKPDGAIDIEDLFKQMMQQHQQEMQGNTLYGPDGSMQQQQLQPGTQLPERSSGMAPGKSNVLGAKTGPKKPSKEQVHQVQTTLEQGIVNGVAGQQILQQVITP